jgi:hypothetical protein
MTAVLIYLVDIRVRLHNPKYTGAFIVDMM